MSSQNSYYKLIREKIEKAKIATVDFLKQPDLDNSTHIPPSISFESTLSLQSNSDSSFILSNQKDQYREWHKFALQIFFSKFSHVKLRTKRITWR